MEEKFKKIANFSIILLCLIIPLAFYPRLENVFELFKITILKIVVFSIFALYLAISVYRREIKIPKSPLLIPLILYLFIVFISTLFSYQRNVSYNELINIFTYFLLFLIVISFYEEEKNVLLFTAISLSAAVISLYALLQHLRIDFIEWSDPIVYLRSTSTLGNPDFVSAYLSLVLPLILSFLIIQEKPIFKILLFLNFLLSFTALLLTYSRGGWLTFLLVITIFLFLLEKNKIRENLPYILALFISLTVIVIIFSPLKISIDQRATNIPGRIKSLTDIHYPSFSIRRHLWHDAILMISGRPILGWGPDTFTVVFPKFRSPELSYLAGRNNLPENPHNEYLNIAANSGFLGLFSFLFLVMVILKYSFKKAKYGNLYLGIFATLVGFFFQSLFYYKIVPTYFLFFLLTGIIAYKKGELSYLKFDFFHKPTIFILYLFIIISTFFFVSTSISEVLANKHYRRGKTYIDVHLWLKAENEFIKAQKFSLLNIFSPYNKNYRLALGSTYEQMAISIQKNDKKSLDFKKFLFERGIKEYKEAINLSKNEPYSYADLARIYFHYSRLNNNYKKLSIENYKIAQRLDPKNCVFYNDLGVVYLAYEDYKNAIREFENAVKLEPHYAEAWENLGMSHYYLKNKEKAVFYLEKAIKEEPNLFSAYIRIAVILLEKKEKAKAINYLNKANKIFPQNLTIKKLLEDIKKK